MEEIKGKSIGKHGVYTLEQARTEAKKILLMMHQGIDPVAQKRQLKSDFKSEKESNELIPTLEKAYEVYKSKKKLSKNTIDAYDRCANDYFKEWKNIKITDISQRMTLNKHMDLSQRSLAQANLAMKFLSAVYNFNASILYNDKDEKIITEKAQLGSFIKKRNGTR
jgi:hypothetical protein